MSGGDLVGVLIERGSSLEIARTISLGWYDGPREGFLWLAEPRSAWYFALWAELPSSEDVDDRLYALSLLPDDGEQVIERALEPLSPPADGHWVATWSFPSDHQETAANEALDALTKRLPAPSVVLRSAFLRDVNGIWLVVPPPQDL